MNRSLTLTAVALAATLAACGQAQQGEAVRGGSIGVSSSSSSNSETGVSAELSRLRKEVVAKDAKASVSMAASTVVDAAFAQGLSPGASMKLKLGSGLRLVSTAEDAQAYAVQMLETSALRALLMNEVARVRADASTPEFTALEKADAMLRASMLYSVAVRGAPAWQVRPPIRGIGASDANSVWAYQAYTRAHEMGACVAATLGGALAKQLTGVVLKDPETARAAAQPMAMALLADLAADTLASCEYQYPFEAGRSVNATGVPGAVWQTNRVDGQTSVMNCTAAGCEVIQAGVTLLGKGVYSGVSYELAFARAVGTSSERSSGTSANNGANQSTSTQNQVGLGS